MRRLVAGEKAPLIQAQDIKGGTVHYTATGSWAFISFHRFAACPFCNLYTHELIKSYPQFKELGIQIMSLWPSSLANLRRFVGQAEAPFPLLSDPEKLIYEKYKATEKSKAAALKLALKPGLVRNAMKYKFKNTDVDSDPTLLPASFLVSPDGIIAIAHYGKHYGDSLSVNKIFSTVKKKTS